MPSKSKKAISSKKDLRDKLSIQLHMVLAAFKESVSEKKLEKLVKKTAKQLAEALHHNKTSPPAVIKKAAVKTPAPPKKTALKK